MSFKSDVICKWFQVHITFRVLIDINVSLNLCYSLFTWKDQKQQLELPEAKASTGWNSAHCPPLTMEPSCHLPFTGQPLSALCRMDPSLCSCLLKAGLLLHELWLLSFIPRLLGLGTVHQSTSYFSLHRAVPIPQQAIFFSWFKPSVPLGTFLSVSGPGLMDKASSHHHNTGVIWFLGIHHQESFSPALS